MAYEIGYRRPPKSGQFTKGKTGNPRGRPKGSKSFMSLLAKELGQSIVVNENGKKKTITRLQAMVKKMVSGALNGDQKAMLTLVEILKRTGQFETTPESSLLPDNYEALLTSYIAQRGSTPLRTESKKPNKE